MFGSSPLQQTATFTSFGQSGYPNSTPFIASPSPLTQGPPHAGSPAHPGVHPAGHQLAHLGAHPGGHPGALPGAIGHPGGYPGAHLGGYPGPLPGGHAEALPAAIGYPGALPGAVGHPGAIPAVIGYPGAIPGAVGHPGAIPGAVGHPGAIPGAVGHPGALPGAVGHPGYHPVGHSSLMHHLPRQTGSPAPAPFQPNASPLAHHLTPHHRPSHHSPPHHLPPHHPTPSQVTYQAHTSPHEGVIPSVVTSQGAGQIKLSNKPATFSTVTYPHHVDPNAAAKEYDEYMKRKREVYHSKTVARSASGSTRRSTTSHDSRIPAPKIRYMRKHRGCCAPINECFCGACDAHTGDCGCLNCEGCCDRGFAQPVDIKWESTKSMKRFLD